MQWQWQHPTDGVWHGFPQNQQPIFQEASASGNKTCTIDVGGQKCEANLVERYVITADGHRFNIRAADANSEFAREAPLAPSQVFVQQQQQQPSSPPSAPSSGQPSPSSGKIRGWGEWAAGKVDNAATKAERKMQDRTDKKVAQTYRDPTAPDKQVPAVMKAGGTGLMASSGAVCTVAEGVSGAVCKAGEYIGKKIGPSDPNGVIVQSCDAYVKVSESIKDGTGRVIKATGDGYKREAEAKHGKEYGELVGQFGHTAENVGKTVFAVKDTMHPVKGVAKGVAKGVVVNSPAPQQLPPQ